MPSAQCPVPSAQCTTAQRAPHSLTPCPLVPVNRRRPSALPPSQITPYEYLLGGLSMHISNTGTATKHKQDWSVVLEKWEVRWKLGGCVGVWVCTVYSCGGNALCCSVQCVGVQCAVCRAPVSRGGPTSCRVTMDHTAENFAVGVSRPRVSPARRFCRWPVRCCLQRAGAGAVAGAATQRASSPTQHVHISLCTSAASRLWAPSGFTFRFLAGETREVHTHSNRSAI